MNKSQAAKYLQISVRTLERYNSEGRLQARRVRSKTGPALDFDEAELAHFKAALAAGLPLEPISDTGSPQEPTEPPQDPTESTKALAQVEPSGARELQVLAGASATSQGQVLVSVEALSGLMSALGEAQKRPHVSTAEKLLLDLAEASALSGLSRGHLRAAIDSGELRAKRIGRSWKLLRADLLKYLEGLLQ